MDLSRVERVLDNLADMGLDQAIICDPMAVFWLSDYRNDPYERFFALLVARDREPVMFCNRLFPDATPFCDRVVVFDDTEDPIPMVARELDATKPAGIDKNLAARWLLPLMDAQAATAFRLASDAVDGARSIKDARELDLMRAASATNDRAMEWLASQVRAGVTERQIAEGLLSTYRRLGAEDHSFPPIVSFGANASDPHHEPDDTVLEPGELVLFDVGCMRDSYASDMTRTFWYAGPDDVEPTPEFRKIYEVVRAANEAAEKIVRPGVEFAEIDRAARSVIEDAGYGEYFTHRLGHQIGLEDHEPGDVSSAHHEPVRPGQTFSIEPGIYLPGGIGVRIEDLVIVTGDGCEVINSYPKQLTVLR